MFRRDLLKSLATLIPASLLPVKLQELEVKPFRAKKSEKPFRTKLTEFANGCWNKYTYNKDGNQLTCENSYGYWSKNTYDSNGNQLTYENSNGYWSKNTYDSNGNQLTCEDSTGYWQKYTYDQCGNQLSKVQMVVGQNPLMINMEKE